MLDILPLFFLGVFGLIVGSFLNVVILRFGFGESRQPRSHCMSCAAAIQAYDLIPVVSYLYLRGRCRVCGSALSLQYPLVEIGTALLFLAAYTILPPVTTLGYLAFASLLVFLSLLVVLTVYDLRHTLVPMPFIVLLASSAVAAATFQSIVAQSFASLIDGAWGALALSAFFYTIYAVTRGRGMGLGDAYIAGAAGMLLGLTRGIEAVMLAFWIGTLIALPILLLSSLLARFRLFWGGRRVTMKTELPFVPFLALGVVLALFTDLSPLAFGTWLAQLLWFVI